MSSFSYTPSPISHGDSLLTALFIASVLHAIILMGLNFSIPQAEKVSKSIEITLSSTPSKKAPKKARYLAQDNQVGAGSETKKPEPPKQKLPSNGATQKKQLTQKRSATKPKAAQKRVTVKRAPEKISTAAKPAPQVKSKKTQISAEALKKQIAQLGEKIRQRQTSSEYSKIKFVNQVSTHKYVAAQYMKDWENKVERTGNLNYPEIARKKGFSGTLTMDVGIKADGSIYSMRITKSSGIKALDDAAKRIVRLSAPFAALPTDILQELDVLVITRVWKFSDESGMTTR
jgi:protein TonB